jgi:hypothetical protein
MILLPRNVDLKQIPKILGSDGRVICNPADITVSSGSAVNGWNDSSGNGFDHNTPGGTCTKVTGPNGDPAVEFSSGGSLTGAAFSSIMSGSTKFWGLAVLKQQQSGGGSSAAGSVYTNPGASGDSGQYLNWCQFSTRSGVDYFQAEVWIDGSTAKLAECTTNPTGSTTRGWMIAETWVTAGNVLHVRCQDGTGTAQATQTGCTSIGSYNHMLMGTSGAAAMHVTLGYQLFCNVSPDPVKQAHIRKILGRRFGIFW